MPPPPPPSKSYLLVFDTDSEDEEEDSYYPRPSPPAPTPPQAISESALTIQEPAANACTTTTTTTPETTASTSSRCRRPHVVEDDDDDDDDDDDSGEDLKESLTDDDDAPKKLSKSQKKNLARRKKKKSKWSSGNDVASEKQISFSTVSIRSYERCFSADTVPLDGGWPLGSELDKFEDQDEVALEDFETLRQETLRDRWEHVKENGKKIDENVSKKMTERPSSGEPVVLETRQWDYLIGTKNPLFRPLGEEERQELFLQYSSELQSEAQENSGSTKPASAGSHLENTNLGDTC
jgi:hypothetical protein